MQALVLTLMPMPTSRGPPGGNATARPGGEKLHEEIVGYAAGQGGRDRGSGLPPMMNDGNETGGTGGGGGAPKSSVVR